MKKTTAHVMNGYGGSFAGLPGAMLVNVSPEYVRRVREQLGPGKQIVVRWWEWTQTLDNPEQDALDWFTRHQFEMMMMCDAGRDKFVAFQAYNEVPGALAEPYWWFERRRMELMHNANFPIALFAASVGEFDLRVWPLFAPIIRDMRPEDLVLLHEYYVDTAGIDNLWHCARWQLVPELGGVRIAIGETGRDIVEGRGQAGWRKTCDRATFERDLQKYDAKMCENPNVVWGAVFGCGLVTPDWAAFDSNELIPWMVANTEQGGAPVPETPQPEQKPKVVFPLKNTGKAWYSADALFGEYDQHPARAEDFNLESFGNTDRGEPLVAPFRGVVLNAEDYGKGQGGIIAILSFESLDTTPDLNLFRVKHCETIAVKRGDVVEPGQVIGTIGTAHEAYASHAHVELVIVPIPTPTEPWYATRFLFVRPSDWFANHGVSRELVERLRKYDGR